MWISTSLVLLLEELGPKYVHFWMAWQAVKVEAPFYKLELQFITSIKTLLVRQWSALCVKGKG